MPAVPQFTVDEPEPNAIHVLLTGFGPFWRYEENPSWAAVKPLHNKVIYAEVYPQPPPEPQPLLHPLLPPGAAPPPPPPPPVPEPAREPHDAAMLEDATPIVQQIYIHTLQIPVVYQSVLSITPGLHAKPPILPPPEDPEFAHAHLPPNGFDFIFHIGVAGRGPLRLEKLAHKLGYSMKDAEGQYAPIVHLPKEVPQVDQPDPEVMEKLLLPPANVITDLGPPGPPGLPRGVVDHEDLGGERPVESVENQPQRGHGKAYETLPDELYTEIDVPRLIHHLKETGIQKVYSSMDAGHYLCDFLFYSSLAEAKRHATKQEKDKARSTPPKMTPVLFMHCGPVGQPLETEEVTDAIKKTVLYVCSRLSA